MQNLPNLQNDQYGGTSTANGALLIAKLYGRLAFGSNLIEFLRQKALDLHDEHCYLVTTTTFGVSTTEI